MGMADDLEIPMPRMAPAWRVREPARGLDAHTRRLAIIAGGIGLLLVAVLGFWGIRGSRTEGVPIVAADPRPVRAKPTDAGGMEVTGQDEAILGGGSTTAEKDTLAPPPETPAPQALEQMQKIAEKPAARPAEAKVVPVPPPAPPKQTVALTQPVPVLPQSAVSAAPERVTRSPKSVLGQAFLGGAQVQLAALPTEDLANTEWIRLVRRLPELLTDRRPAISKVERDGRAFWRVRTGGFADAATATAFCVKIRARGTGCSVAAF